MKIALLSKYSRLGASSRLRTLQYIPFLREAGIEVQVLSLFDDAYLRNLYSGKGRSLRTMFGYYRKRATALRNLKNVDLILLEKEAFPYLPFWLEKILMPSRVPYVADYDDAIFHNYDLSENHFIKVFLGRKIDKVMATAAKVVCGNDYLAMRAIKAGAPHVEIVPTVVDASRYSTCHATDNRKPVIGWIGSYSTQRYILDMQQVLQRVCNDAHAQLVLVGAQPELKAEFHNMPVRISPWEEHKEAEAVAGFDIGIMPLVDGPWERGKCGYKLIQYMACGLPVVASPVGVNSEIVRHGENGFLASTPQEWEEALVQLIEDPALRERMGKSGRSQVETEYSLQIQAPRWVQILRKARG